MPEEEYLSKDKKEKLPRIEKFKLIMEYVKWFVVSVVLVVIALIIDSGFKSRDQGLKEMTQYDKYIDVLVYNDNVGAKVKLAEFLSIITTSKDLRDRWGVYLEKVRAEYDEYQKLNDSTEAQIEKLNQKNSPTEKEIKTIEKLEDKKSEIESQLKKEIQLPPKFIERNLIPKLKITEPTDEQVTKKTRNQIPIK